MEVSNDFYKLKYQKYKEKYLSLKNNMNKNNQLGGSKTKNLTRPSPSESATLFPEGTEKKGNDGNMYVIKVDKNGVKRWKKSSDTKKSSKKPVKVLKKTSKKRLKKQTVNIKQPILGNGEWIAILKLWDMMKAMVQQKIKMVILIIILGNYNGEII